MDLIQRLGGRKFLMATAVIGAAMFLEMRAPGGLTATMSAFLLGIVGMFSVANYANTSRHMSSKQPAGDLPDFTDLTSKVEDIHRMTSLSSAGDQENVKTLVKVLESLHGDMQQVKSSTSTIGTSMVNLVGKRS